MTFGASLEALRAGGVIACPTETLVGLLADAHCHSAIERIMSIKGRAAHQPIALLIPDFAMLGEVAEDLTPIGSVLARQHWPGPLTLVVVAKRGLHPALLQDGKVGIRIPGRSPALDIVQAFGGPLTATSANLSGQPAVSSTAMLEPGVRSAVDYVIEGAADLALPSTVVDVSGEMPVLLRQGALRV
ncbi:MAG: threonylcarbamoyl-AMP synthase [Myxococcales bacterium]|nr:threonylcarbamoyl-AMP synthase [Myxococcales bacterium]MCB9709401.1 threonylcarbamoyl-AMP synthase [Myxococcales bacterium]